MAGYQIEMSIKAGTITHNSRNKQRKERQTTDRQTNIRI